MLPAVTSKRDLAISFSQELPRYFNKQEVETILMNSEDHPKDHLLMSVLWNTGARISEALRLCIKDIDFYGKAIRLTTLKRKQFTQRVLPMQGHLAGLLGAHVAGQGIQRDDLIFDFTRQRAYQIVSDAVLKAGLDQERAHPHTFRHSFAVHCVLSGVPILVLKEWLGHSNIQNTLIYLKVLGSDTRHFYDAIKF
jgi:site-specific recombinase XerD